jgi:cytochrome c oxidase assembly protein subunit 15
LKNYRKFALLTLIATYLVIFVGGLVRVSGAGLGCPDWPTCYGRWIPPISIDQVPIDQQATFNITLAWIEYANRVLGVVLGFLILITAMLALKHYRNYSRILYPSLAAAVLVALEGYQGSVVISSGLEPLVVSVHMVLALFIVSLLIYSVQQAYYVEFPKAGSNAVFPAKTKFMLGSLWVLAIAQVILGTQIRSSLEILARKFPLLDDVQWLSKVSPINHIHMTLGIILALITWRAGLNILRKGSNLDSLTRQASVAVIALVTLQALIGFMFLIFGMPQLAQLFHLWTASLYVGALLVLYAAYRKVEKVEKL